jgi:Family of unknown function (DUF6492)
MKDADVSIRKCNNFWHMKTIQVRGSHTVMDFDDQATLNWAVITPSYIGDLERCNLLCESMDIFLQGPWHHYIVVDQRELGLFSHLNGPRRTVLVEQNILPNEMKYVGRLPFGRKLKLWWSWKTGFMGGWQIQQLLKLQMAHVVKQDAMLMCDSDTFFIRPSNVSKLSESGVIRFLRSAHEYPETDNENITNFSKVAFALLNLKEPHYPVRNYVDNMIPWHAAMVRQLCQHITQVQNKPWYVAIGQKHIFSEYTLYGLYVDRLAKDHSMLAPVNESLCFTIWAKDGATLQNLESAVATLPPQVVAIGVQSNLSADSKITDQLFRQILNSTT